VTPIAGTSTGSVERFVNLGRGRVVPYPEPSSDAATKIGKANRRVDTKAEVLLRSSLHRRGLRFRKDHLVRVSGVRVRPDIVFTRIKLAVFVDGCFWHGCPDHQHIPKRNREYWVPKLLANVERDRRVDAALACAGWVAERIWEHEENDCAADRVQRLVYALTDALPGSTPAELPGTRREDLLDVRHDGLGELVGQRRTFSEERRQAQAVERNSDPAAQDLPVDA